jgi:hypothetical protein
MDSKIRRKSINDLPLQSSPETLTTLENSNYDRIEDINSIKLILMKPKRAYLFMLITIFLDLCMLKIITQIIVSNYFFKHLIFTNIVLCFVD